MKKIYSRILLIVGITVLTSSSFASSLPASSIVPLKGDPAATAKAAMEEFKSLSHKEKKARFKEAKKAFKAIKAESRAKKEPVASTAVQVIVAILLPPLGVYLHEGEINSRFWIGLILWLLFYFPGLIYALIVILGNKSKN